jgi:muramidase (phage lysozyme)
VNENLRAFLDMIAVSEGTKGHGDDGYNVIVGGDLFTGYADHPRRVVTLNRQGLKSSAAGRYQILARYFDAYKAQLKLPDFSPASQDAIAVQMIRERGAMADILAGRFSAAVHKVRNVWASLPGAGYGQRENELADLRVAYMQAGGILTEA